MKKNEIFEKKITMDVVVAGLKMPKSYVLEASEKELKTLEKRFDVEKIHFLKAYLTVYPNDIVKVQGKIESLTRRECVVSLEKFDEKMNEEFEVLYADNPPADSDEIIDVIDKGRIHLGEIIAEQYGLALNPFPHAENRDRSYAYLEKNEISNRPFRNLSKIIKK